jgi:hypothetical protein
LKPTGQRIVPKAPGWLFLCQGSKPRDFGGHNLFQLRAFFVCQFQELSQMPDAENTEHLENE